MSRRKDKDSGSDKNKSGSDKDKSGSDHEEVVSRWKTRSRSGLGEWSSSSIVQFEGGV